MEGGEEHQDDDGTTHLVGHQLSQDDTERQLTSSGQTITKVGTDQSVDILRDGTNDATNETQDHAHLDDPLASENIRETSEHEETHGRSKSPNRGHPIEVGRRTNVGVDEGAGARLISASSSVTRWVTYRVFAGNTHPRYAQLLARQTAFQIVSSCQWN
jgi:hypothetical protein